MGIDPIQTPQMYLTVRLLPGTSNGPLADWQAGSDGSDHSRIISALIAGDLAAGSRPAHNTGAAIALFQAVDAAIDQADRILARMAELTRAASTGCHDQAEPARLLGYAVAVPNDQMVVELVDDMARQADLAEIHLPLSPAAVLALLQVSGPRAWQVIEQA